MPPRRSPPLDSGFRRNDDAGPGGPSVPCRVRPHPNPLPEGEGVGLALSRRSGESVRVANPTPSPSGRGCPSHRPNQTARTRGFHQAKPKFRPGPSDQATLDSRRGDRPVAPTLATINPTPSPSARGCPSHRPLRPPLPLGEGWGEGRMSAPLTQEITRVSLLSEKCCKLALIRHCRHSVDPVPCRHYPGFAPAQKMRHRPNHQPKVEN